MKLEEVKENINSFWGNIAEGWRHLWQSAAGALTRFKPGESTNLPAAGQVDDDFYLPTRGWAMLGGDVFEDEERLVVRLEVPGMEKDEIAIEIADDVLRVSGEKRFERETTDGRWRVMQCAYGSFRRAVPLPVAVKADAARASYRNGVLRVELPKLAPGKPQAVQIKVD
jgi:HSP20 family protein